VRSLEAKKQFTNPRYMEILMEHFYTKHILRRNLEDWPDPVNRGFARINQELYVTMQGPSEFGLSGRLEQWDRKADLKNIAVPTLVIGAQYDTMDPEHMKWMSTQVQNGSYLYCPDGSHLDMYDDQERYLAGLIRFLKETDAGAKAVQF
ncbi:MAG TPA: proline iminopeptidase, partial [Bacteroidota bacterium]